MPSIHPLELPEILSQVSTYVAEKSLLSCALVSKAWHKVFIPQIWNELLTNKDIPDEAVISHCHLIKTIDILNTVVADFPKWRFPNLDTLSVTYEGPEELTEFILAHPNISHLVLRRYTLNPEAEFWTQLLGFHNLKSFSVTRLNIQQEQEMNIFWQLCTRLEKLDLTIGSLSSLGNLSSMEFSRLQRLYLNSSEDYMPLSLILLQRCPSLTTIFWDGALDERLISEFSQFVKARTWPGLENLLILPEDTFSIPQEVLSDIIRGMHRVVTLSLTDLTRTFGPESMELIRPHFAHLKELDFKSDNGLTSSMALEILSSCPSLGTLAVPLIEAAEMVAGKPWVCTRLELLSAYFRFPPDSLDELQPLVLDQLSKLTQLQTLCTDADISRLPDDESTPFPQETFDWRLEKGLDKLSTLRSLGYFSFRYTYQKIGLQEAEWMVKHWEDLFFVAGVLNMDPEVKMELKNYLNDRGIHIGILVR
ncbi:MAG: hypothetical protein J3Q66DRAFT_352506 [Benniella sp.]|nr:MAG: hypothetical protein J3Q66DRAFT_352506 [Benniella sp.]